MTPEDPSTAGRIPLRLHVGGQMVREGWKILNIQPGPGVDFVGNVIDLSPFADGSVDELYASHVYEHLSYMDELPRALREAHRVLRRGGILRMGVPDLEVLCRLMVTPSLTLEEKRDLLRMIYGGQTDAFDFHKAGFFYDHLAAMLKWTGFSGVKRVREFGLFADTTLKKFKGVPVSLNVEAVK